MHTHIDFDLLCYIAVPSSDDDHSMDKCECNNAMHNILNFHTFMSNSYDTSLGMPNFSFGFNN